PLRLTPARASARRSLPPQGSQMSVLAFSRAARLRAVIVALASGSALAAASSVEAQDSTVHQRGEPNEFERRSSGSIAFVQTRPFDGLGTNIGFGYGAVGTYVFRLDRSGYFGLR